MIEWTVTGNLGKDAGKTRAVARATVCANIPVNNTLDTEAVWIDIETADIGLAAQLLGLKKGDGVMVRGNMRVNYYERNGRKVKGWTMDLNSLNVTYRKN